MTRHSPRNDAARSTADLSIREARRLALAKAGLLKADWVGLPARAAGGGAGARQAALSIIDHFGYLQLDTVSIAGARSHAIVLLSRLAGFDPALAESLLRPREPIFEYWGHEASWLPLSLYPTFAFRRRDFQHHPWWDDIVGKHPRVAANLRDRIRQGGPIRSLEMEGRGSRGWWDLKIAKRVASALWSSGELAIRERRNFQRAYDLAERVIPASCLAREIAEDQALEQLLLRALRGHGWATSKTLIDTWRLRGRRREIASALARLEAAGRIQQSALQNHEGPPTTGWITPEDRELAARLERTRPRAARGVLLSPFDPVLWDRERVQRLFAFHQVLEIFKPAAKRVYGYYCLPVLAGEHLVARFDLKADRRTGRLRVLACHFEEKGCPAATSRAAAESALTRYAEALALKPTRS